MAREVPQDSRAWGAQCRPRRRPGRYSFPCTVVRKDVPDEMVSVGMSCLGPREEEQTSQTFTGTGHPGMC